MQTALLALESAANLAGSCALKDRLPKFGLTSPDSALKNPCGRAAESMRGTSLHGGLIWEEAVGLLFLFFSVPFF